MEFIGVEVKNEENNSKLSDKEYESILIEIIGMCRLRRVDGSLIQYMKDVPAKFNKNDCELDLSSTSIRKNVIELLKQELVRLSSRSTCHLRRTILRLTTSSTYYNH
nr:hypothetical protein [uncultured Methanolobus sp.]